MHDLIPAVDREKAGGMDEKQSCRLVDREADGS
jgi:hypothetical protein